MYLPLLLGPVLAGQQTPAPQSYGSAPNVAELTRIAVTPRLDGTLSAEEWDPFSSAEGVETYLQWEPRKLHVAAKMPADRDLVVSIDAKSNGWLVGKDNLEVRVHLQDGKPVVTSRVLDATAVAGPSWVDLNGFALAAQAAASQTADGAIVELTLEDPGVGLLPEDPGNTLTVRVDAVGPDGGAAEPYQPRLGAKITMRMDRGTALPVGLRWAPEGTGRILQPGDTTKIRLTFNGTNELGLKKVEMRCEGFLREGANQMTVPFPEFDKKGRAFVDYSTRIDKNTDYGYRLLRGTMTAGDGAPAVTQTSFRVAPMLEFDLPWPNIRPKAQGQTVRLGVYLQSNSGGRIDGTFGVSVPEGWELAKPGDRSFLIVSPRSKVRHTVEVRIPANAKGTFPLKLTAKVGQRTFEETRWITID